MYLSQDLPSTGAVWVTFVRLPKECKFRPFFLYFFVSCENGSAEALLSLLYFVTEDRTMALISQTLFSKNCLVWSSFVGVAASGVCIVMMVFHSCPFADSVCMSCSFAVFFVVFI